VIRIAECPESLGGKKFTAREMEKKHGFNNKIDDCLCLKNI
jgi:hypothetical protein